MPARTPSVKLQASSLTIRRRHELLIDRLTFEHQAGSICWVVGENGAGKSTLLQVLARRLRPASGTVAYTEASSARISYFQPAMTGPPECAFGSWVELQRRLWPDTAALLPWTDPFLPTLLRSVTVTQLSTGERKRLLLHALLRRPTDVTILDEPYEHLSASAKQRLSEILGARAAASIVVIATNQPIPSGLGGTTLLIDRDPG
jgi:ABC-type transport system involved in cytochrome c biogenesis ATPase subunit